MNDQEKQAIKVLTEAVNLACTRGAFSLNEAGQLAMAVQIARSLLASAPAPATVAVQPDPDTKEKNKP